MRVIRVLPLLLGIALQVSAAPASKSFKFVKVIEAEQFSTKGKFTQGRDEARNVVYIANEDGGPVSKERGREPREEEATTHSVSVPTDGNYYIWGRIWVYNKSGDSLFVKVGTGRNTWVIEHEAKDVQFHSSGDWVIWNDMSGKEQQLRKWIWQRIGSLSGPKRPVYIDMAFKLSAGSHAICFAGREAGARLDKILITNDRHLVPEGASGVAGELADKSDLQTKSSIADIISITTNRTPIPTCEHHD